MQETATIKIEISTSNGWASSSTTRIILLPSGQFDEVAAAEVTRVAQLTAELCIAAKGTSRLFVRHVPPMMKIQAIKILRSHNLGLDKSTTLGLKDAKDIVESVPRFVPVSPELMAACLNEFRQIGCTADLYTHEEYQVAEVIDT